MKKTHAITLLAAIMIILASCNKTDDAAIVPQVQATEEKVETSGANNELSFAVPRAASNYTFAPSPGVWTEGSQTSPCGIGNGNTVKIAISSTDGNKFTIKIKKMNAEAFSTSGTFTITDGSNCGTSLATVQIAVGNTEKEVSITLNLSSGYKDLWGTFSNSTTKYNAGHIAVSASDTRKINTSQLIYYSQLNTECRDATYRSWGCLPASCLMGRKLAKYTFDVNATEFTNMCSGMGTTTGGTYISSAATYLKQTSQLGTSQSSLPSISTSTAARDQIITYLAQNRSIVCLVWYSTSNKKLSTTGSAKTQTGGVGHFITVVGITHTGNNNGVIYYYDPYGNPGLQSASLSTFLTSMPLASTS